MYRRISGEIYADRQKSGELAEGDRAIEGDCMKYSKYGNKPVKIDGLRYASMKEASRHKELMLLEKVGKIKNLRFQVAYELIPAQYETFERYSDKTGKRLKDGKRCVEESCKYIADFVYQDAGTGEWIVEDSKGKRTKDYIIKRKLMLYIHGIRVHEV